jgi:hypothetical protein
MALQLAQKNQYSRCRFYVYLYTVSHKEIVGKKMVKIQGSDGRMDKRKIAILNIDSILNKNFFGPNESHSKSHRFTF